MVNDSDTQTLRIDTSLNRERNIRGIPSPASSQISSQTPASPGSPGSPGSPNSANSDHHISDYMDFLGSRNSSSRFSEDSLRISSDM